MRTAAIAVSLAVTAALGGCTARRAAVPLVGAPADISALVGQWVGEYSSTETGRIGSLSFTLRALGDTAHGDVVMVPNGWNQPLQPWRDETTRAAERPRPEVLTIRFVRVTGNEVSGELAPYRDPGCDCKLYTRFVGRLNRDVIEGTFTTSQSQSAQEQRGRWSAKQASR